MVNCPNKINLGLVIYASLRALAPRGGGGKSGKTLHQITNVEIQILFLAIVCLFVVLYGPTISWLGRNKRQSHGLVKKYLWTCIWAIWSGFALQQLDSQGSNQGFLGQQRMFEKNLDKANPSLCLCSSDRYMIHLYCLAIQAGFYSNVVECWPVTQAAWVWFLAGALVIRIFSPVTPGAQR